MAESIKELTGAMAVDGPIHRRLLEAGLTDADQITNIRADLVELRTKFIAALTKLDADAGVTDTNYASTLTPAALTTVATGRQLVP